MAVVVSYIQLPRCLGNRYKVCSTDINYFWIKLYVHRLYVYINFLFFLAFMWNSHFIAIARENIQFNISIVKSVSLWQDPTPVWPRSVSARILGCTITSDGLIVEVLKFQPLHHPSAIQRENENNSPLNPTRLY